MTILRAILILLVGTGFGFMIGTEYGKSLIRTRWSKILGFPAEALRAGPQPGQSVPDVRLRQERLLIDYRRAYEASPKAGAKPKPESAS